MKSWIVRIAITLMFLVTAIILINIAPKYEVTYKYKNGDLRVILDDVEITRNKAKLPEVAVLLNGEVLLSQNTVDILFDKNLYYEKKYDTLITTSNNHRADIKVDSNIITIDGKENGIKVPAIRDEYNYVHDDRYEEETSVPNNRDIIYVPIKALERVYGIDIKFKDKIIITRGDRNIFRCIIPDEKTLEVKYLKDDSSKTLFTIKSNDYVEVFDFAEFEDYNLVRTSEGELGYASTKLLKEYGIEQVCFAPNLEEDMPKENITLAWDYINPDFSSIGDKAERSKIPQLDVVAPTLLFLQNTDGEVTFRINSVKEYMSWAKDMEYKVWVTFKNDGKSIQETSDFLNDMEHRNRCIYELIEFAKAYKVDGINIDFENMYQEDAEVFSQFIRELNVEMKNANLVLSVCVNIPDGSPTWSLCYQHKALSEAADYLAVMTYDCRNELSSYASYDWVDENIGKIVVRDKVEPSKVLLGIAFDSSYWKTSGGKNTRSVFYMSSAKKYLKDATWNNEAMQYYYENKSKNELIWIEEKKSIKEKLNLIDSYGLAGVACWCLGQETEDVWEAF